MKNKRTTAKKNIGLFTILVAVLSFMMILSTAGTPGSFKDVSSKHWATADIDALVGKKILSGFPDGTFKPENNVTRAQAAKIISLAADIKPVAPSKASFTDVSKGHWAYSYIEALTARGILHGTGNGKFDPESELTRAQMSKILTKSFGFVPESENFFKDVKSDAWYFEYVMALRDNEITVGYPKDNTYRPNDNVTRAQMAAFSNRSIKWKAGSQNQTPTPEPEVTPAPELTPEKPPVIQNPIEAPGPVKPTPVPETTPEPGDDVPIDDSGETLKPVPFSNAEFEPIDENLRKEIEQQFVAAHNELRRNAGVGPLTVDAKATEYARIKSKDMFENKYFDHDSPTWNGSTFSYMESQGIAVEVGAENIATGYYHLNSVEDIMKGIENSPGHYANAIAYYDHIGVGVYANKTTGQAYYTFLYVMYE